MPLESTMICVDNSEFMRNGDFVPTRLQAQQEAAQLICRSKFRAHPQNDVGILTMGKLEVLVSLTNDIGRILVKLYHIRLDGQLNFLSGFRLAQLALKHRMEKIHKMRIVAFVGSPLEVDQSEMIALAKKLKKENVNVDIICFGDATKNADLLSAFIGTLNGKDGYGSHFTLIPSGPSISDQLGGNSILESSSLQDTIEDHDDPDLAMALSLSLEEYSRGRNVTSSHDTVTNNVQQHSHRPEDSVGAAMYENAMSMSLSSSMTEEEQIRLALALSMREPPYEESSEYEDSLAYGYSEIPYEPVYFDEDDQNGPLAEETDSLTEDSNKESQPKRKEDK